MTVRINGNGAGAHAFAWKFAESRLCEHLICTPGNAGTQTLCDTATDGIEDIIIPQVQLLWEDTLPTADINLIDLCIFYDGKHYFPFPKVNIHQNGIYLYSEIHNADHSKNVCAVCVAAVDEHKHLMAEPGIYTFRFVEIPFNLIQIYKGLPDGTACTVLPMFKGDLVQIFHMIKTGFPDDFILPLREGSITVFRFDGIPGDHIKNLSKLPGDIGVFLDQMTVANGELLFTGTSGLYLCARESALLHAKEKVTAARQLLQITH